ncbi:hypothetical protein [Pseudomonas brassicacearum]|uniref:hypothetical protein n=1 Tax=Pseudomonas brassicacearum TaxID=930166 RepID=UPI0011F0E4A5|nr:hypothetical protein [Pseudomonas brassicacearum]QEO78839.1 hypothetical protein ELZ14_15185 [Pseudomonas brassicacearum]
MNLSEYFATDDGSLPEIVVTYSDSSLAPKAFQYLFDRGAKNVTVDGGYLWINASQSEKPFSGPQDAMLVCSGAAEAFHVVLTGLHGCHSQIPDLGVYVFPDSLTLDYRMGAQWGRDQIHSFLDLLRHLKHLGGVVSIPWWGDEGEREFLAALES